jgi:hypothetical protein
MATLPSKVTIVDVGPRDGLQNEKQMIPAEVKVDLVDRLTDAGFRNIEVTSFVSPKWVPQMADGAEVMARIRRKPGVVYSVLVPNMKGFEAALATKPDEIVVFGAASEAFSQKNINCSIAESIERFRPVVAAAREHGIHVRGAISCALGCPYQGEVKAEAVGYVAKLMKEIGVHHCGVADTIGVATPRPSLWRVRHLRPPPPPRHAGGDGGRTRRVRHQGRLGPFSRHLWPGDRQHLRLPGNGHQHVRHQRGGSRWLPIRQGSDRQRRHRGRAVPAAGPGHRYRYRPSQGGSGRGCC